MSSTVCVTGTLNLIPTPNSMGKYEKAMWIQETVKGIEFEDIMEEEVFDPDIMFLDGEWYQVSNEEKHEPEHHVFVTKVDEGYEFMACYHNGGCSLEEALEDAVKSK